MQMRTLVAAAAVVIGLALVAGPLFAKDTRAGRDDGTALAAASTSKAAKPAPQPSGGDRDNQGPDGRGGVRVAPIFRDVTDAEIAEILAFIDQNMPWMRPDLDRQRESDLEHSRQVYRHLRYEVAQLKELKARDPAAFGKAIEEKQLRFRAQDLAAKARAATDDTERAAFTEELRKVIDKLFDVELATREAQAAQLESRLDALRAELKTRSANREQVVKARLDDMLKGKKEPEHKFRPDSRSPDKGERHDKGEKSDKGDKPDKSADRN